MPCPGTVGRSTHSVDNNDMLGELLLFLYMYQIIRITIVVCVLDIEQRGPDVVVTPNACQPPLSRDMEKISRPTQLPQRRIY